MNIWEIHPALVHFPIALLLSGVALDLVAWWRGKQLLVDAATWLLIAGSATGLLAANFGLLAFYTAPHANEVHQLMFWHPAIAVLSLTLFIYVAVVRWMRRGIKPAVWARLIGLLGAVTLTIAGYLGGYIVYHGGAGIEPELLAASVRGGHKHGKDGGEDKSLATGDQVAESNHVHGSNNKPGETSDSDHAGTQHESREAAASEHYPVSTEAARASQIARDSEEQPGDQEQATAGDLHSGDQRGDKSRENQQQEARDEQPAISTIALPEKERAPEELPRIPPPNASAAEVPSGYRAEVVVTDLTYPTSIEFDDTGTMYVAEGGFNYGDDVAPARILRFSSKDDPETVAEDLNGPITDLLWHDKQLYISHRGKISVLEANGVRDLVTGLPSLGDHHNNQLTVGPDGMLYFGQGTATNSGVVGLDNFKGGWLAKFPEVHDVPAKDIRLHPQAFQTPNVIVLLADKQMKQGGSGQVQDDQRKASDDQKGAQHDGHSSQDLKKTTGQVGHEKGSETAIDKGDSEHQKEKAKELSIGTEHAGHNKNETTKTSGHEKHGKGAKTVTDKGYAADQNAKVKEPTTGAEHAGRGTKEMKKTTVHESHEKGSEAATGKGQADHQGAKSKESQTGAEHAADGATQMKKTTGHAGHGSAKGSDQGMQDQSPRMVRSFAFEAYGKTPPDDGAVRGTVKASGTILRMNPDGSNLEVYAWGLRNPFGVMWGPDDQLYVSDNGYDERGSRPIAHAPDCLWLIKKGAWYGFPDYAGGIPVTDAEFRPEHGPPLRFVMRDHPLVEKPLLSLQPHVAAAKIAFSKNEKFGFDGQLFLALAGDMNPITGMHDERSGFEVVRFDPDSGGIETFFKAQESALGPKGMEYVATAGPRRPVDVHFSTDGTALYVVDVGAMAIVPTATGPAPRPFPRTGVIWRITHNEESDRQVTKRP